jgi:putative ATP-binding cassette transporter
MEIWQLLRSFGDVWLRRLAIIMVVTGIGLAASNALLAEIALADAASDYGFRLLLVFLLALGVSRLGLYRAFMMLTERVLRANARLQLRTLTRVLDTDLRTVERTGLGEIVGIFSRCVGFMATAVTPISRCVRPIAGLFGTVVILAVTSAQMLTSFIFGLAPLLAGWVICQVTLATRFRRAIEAERTLSASLHQLIAGFKEIKFAPAKGEDLEADRIAPVIAKTAALRSSTGSLLALNHVLVTAVPLLLAAIVGVMVPVLFPDLAEMAAIAATLIIMLPGGILEYATDVARTNAAYGELGTLEDRLPPERGAVVARRTATPTVLAPLETLAFDNVTFSYRDGDMGDDFGVGPLSFTIRAREITFIIGGNGSGKSTLMKLLTGFFLPASGVTRVNGGAISLRAAREYFGVIFPTFHLFNRLYGRRDTDPARVNDLLRRFGLAEVTHYEDGRFTDLALSTGQRKRLAMIVCLIDDKPVLVLDEWAADQDPDFRQMYYRELLPELKAAGKTIIAVTHDDRYFDVADQVIKLEYGKIV